MRLRIGRTSTAIAAALAIFGTGISGISQFAVSQVIEKNPAPLVFGARTNALTLRELIDIKSDPTPFGVAVKKIILVDERAHGRDLKSRRGKSGVVLDQAGDGSQGLDEKLDTFLNKPMSFEVIGEIQTVVTQHYREAGLPLVNVTIPPQEISDSGLQVNVITFQLAQTKIEGESRVPNDFLLDQVRVSKGQEVNPKTLGEDIDWLNQNPFRRATGVFEPGSDYGTTDFVLQIEEKRPWSAYAGLSNSGTSGTFRTRVFAGFNTTNLPWPDHQLSYRLTTSPENLKGIRVLNNGNEKGYLSHALSYFIPITTASGQRYKLAFEALYSDSYTDTGAAVSGRNTSTILSAELAAKLPKSGDDWMFEPELYSKLSLEKLKKSTYFGLALQDVDETDNIRVSVGARARTTGLIFGKAAKGDLDLALESGRSDSSLNGDSSYTYARFSANQSVAVTDEVALALSLRGQFSPKSLSSLDQFGVGGAGSVRGYGTNELSGNSGVVASFELRGSPFQLSSSGLATTLQPYGFIDLGYAGKSGAGTSSETLSSMGFGANTQFGERLTGKLELAHTLNTTPNTNAGETSAHFELVSRF